MATRPIAEKQNIERIFLQQGSTISLSVHEQVEIFTPLGSCVSCILFHPDAGTFMTHAKFPHHEGSRTDAGESVELSTRLAVEHFARSNIPKRHWSVMLFGGGIIHHTPGKHVQFSMLGWQNISSALEVLQEKGILISLGNFGGFGGRRLRYRSSSGQASCEQLENSYGGISVDSKTPAWILLESMQNRIQTLRNSVAGNAEGDMTFMSLSASETAPA